eukprot:scaffold39194_cov106-Phaeocystis_antarctica.AAC.4
MVRHRGHGRRLGALAACHRGKNTLKRDKSESPRPRAVWVDPGRGPGEVSPDPGLPPGQA